MKTLIQNGMILNHAGNLIRAEIWIESGKIKAIGQDFASHFQFEQIYDAKGGLIAPGLVDLHVHFREPGFTEKETILTGSKAAARGGFTTVCAMPNLNPVPDTADKFKQVYAHIEQDACIHVLQYASITKGLKSQDLVDFKALTKVGALAFTNDGVGVQTAGTMYQAMQQAAALNKSIVAHAEDESLLFGGVMHAGKKATELNLPGILSASESAQIARDLILAQETGVHYHICHVSAKESVQLIRQAKQNGINVTAEVCPHHLLLDENDILSDHGNYKMNPPLRSADDREALIQGLLDGTLDCISSDHAPHCCHEKNTSMLNASFGITGSETAFALLYTQFVLTKRFTLAQLIHWMSVKPAQIFNLSAGTLEIGAAADIAIFDLTTEEEIKSEGFLSKSKNTPFIGYKVKGTTLLTFVNGKLVWRKEQE